MALHGPNREPVPAPDATRRRKQPRRRHITLYVYVHVHVHVHVHAHHEHAHVRVAAATALTFQRGYAGRAPSSSMPRRQPRRRRPRGVLLIGGCNYGWSQGWPANQ